MIERGVTDASATTIWRWLDEDAIKPSQQCCWIFIRDPDFAPKAGRALDLYQRRFQCRRTFSRQDLDALLARIDRYEPQLALAA